MKYVSGIRPSGKLHIGNYLGAIKYWKDLQDSGVETMFFIADMHGQHTAAEIIATGIALQKCGIKNVWIQATFSEILLNLAHELSFYITFGQLNRMTQFKDKTRLGENPTLALFSYPALMAADILHHRATHVPVGADQKQHVEFVRDLYDHLPIEMQKKYKKPEPVIFELGARIMSLTNPLTKMGKSDHDDDSRINLCDDADTIARKIKSAVTSANVMDDCPAANNLREIYYALGGRDIHTQWGSFKKDLTAMLVAKFVEGK